MGRGSSKSRKRHNAPPAYRPQPLTIAADPVGSESTVGVIQRRTMMAMSHYSGPTPPVEVLEGYERVAPGSAKQILDQFIKQSEHRMSLERRVIQSDIYRSWGGLIAGLVVSLAFLVGGVSVILYGHDTAGASIATTSLFSLVGVFIYGTSSQRKEREQKAKIMADTKKQK